MGRFILNPGGSSYPFFEGNCPPPLCGRKGDREEAEALDGKRLVMKEPAIAAAKSQSERYNKATVYLAA